MEKLKIEGDDRGRDGWMASLTQLTWQALGVGDGQGSLACCSPWGHRELDMTGQLNKNNIVHPRKRKTNLPINSLNEQFRMLLEVILGEHDCTFKARPYSHWK